MDLQPSDPWAASRDRNFPPLNAWHGQEAGPTCVYPGSDFDPGTSTNYNHQAGPDPSSGFTHHTDPGPSPSYDHSGDPGLSASYDHQVDPNLGTSFVHQGDSAANFDGHGEPGASFDQQDALVLNLRKKRSSSHLPPADNKPKKSPELGPGSCRWAGPGVGSAPTPIDNSNQFESDIDVLSLESPSHGIPSPAQGLSHHDADLQLIG